jgi:hypothetical protein
MRIRPLTLILESERRTHRTSVLATECDQDQQVLGDGVRVSFQSSSVCFWPLPGKSGSKVAALPQPDRPRFAFHVIHAGNLGARVWVSSVTPVNSLALLVEKLKPRVPSPVGRRRNSDEDVISRHVDCSGTA